MYCRRQFTAYIDILRAVSENRVLVEQQQRHPADLAQLERRLRGEMARDEEIATHRRHIVNNLLCLRCPRCEQVFIDFGGYVRQVSCGLLRVVSTRLRCRRASSRKQLRAQHDTATQCVWHRGAVCASATRTTRQNSCTTSAGHMRNELRGTVRAAIQRELADLNIEN